MSKSAPIRDPVHNYIPVTWIERSVIDDAHFQRLRFVLQNSTAYLTYPSNTNTRFAHSLGVMHLSGLMLNRALKNANVETLGNFLKKCEPIFDSVERSALRIRSRGNTPVQEWYEALGNASRFFHNPLNTPRAHFEADETDNYVITYLPNIDAHNEGRTKVVTLTRDPLYIINTLWQAIRLAALVHDFGHFPMSHLFEVALEEFRERARDSAPILDDEMRTRNENYTRFLYERERRELHSEFAEEIEGVPKHELRGIHLVGDVLGRLDYGNYATLVYELANLILLTSTREMNDVSADDDQQVLRAIHRIVAGEIDADRLDYGVRDPHVSGLEFGAVDVKRLLDGMVLYEDAGFFRILPTASSLSAVESFFHQRYLTYKYLVYHHNVRRMDGIVIEIVVRLLQHAYSRTDASNDMVHDLLDRRCFVLKTGSERFLPDKWAANYDDAWFRTVLTEILHVINEDSQLRERHVELGLLLETFLYRRSNNVLSVWKRDTDVHDFISAVEKELKREGSLSEVDSIFHIEPFSFDRTTLAETNRPSAPSKHSGSSIGMSRPSQVSEYWKQLCFREALDRIRDQLPDCVVFFRVSKAKVYGRDAQILVSRSWSTTTDSGGAEVPAALEEVSPYLRTLREVSVGAPNVQIFAVGKNIKSDKRSLSFFQEAIFNELKGYVRELVAA